MANPEHVEILKQGVEAWNQWRKENPDIRPNLSNENLIDAKLSGADLRETNLSEVRLAWADLRGTFLSGAILREAVLYSAKLSGADLRGAKLSGASLARANLTRANLNGATLNRADLSGAKLGGANLGGVDLREANLNNAEVGQTFFGDNDLSLVKGLDVLEHRKPSTVGIDTLYRSGGKIPEAFLRGCGVPENLITFHRSLVGNPIEFYSGLISYSREDASFARRLHDQLQMRGIRCWLDGHQVLPGDDVYEQVDRGVKLWDKVLLCASEHSLRSWWVDKEINTAFTKEQRLMKERGERAQALIPLNLDGHLRSGKWKSGKAEDVLARLAADFTGWESDDAKFEREFERVVKALRADAGAREKTPPMEL
jgi:uncharacterized protein YjbI with pentapeptide repeats